ncbi:hypothetical protein F5Y16DRAFT_405642 [Xylariaceae sp. FL0255]|nr:hypothetical protein F5Y16DRAFT_405642 [Xylariaceae sp. FL0255]
MTSKWYFEESSEGSSEWSTKESSEWSSEESSQGPSGASFEGTFEFSFEAFPESHVPAPRISGILPVLPAMLVPYAKLSEIDKLDFLFPVFGNYLVGLFYTACFMKYPLSFMTLYFLAVRLLVHAFLLYGGACTLKNIRIGRHLEPPLTTDGPITYYSVTSYQGYVWAAIQLLASIVLLPTRPVMLFYMHKNFPAIILAVLWGSHATFDRFVRPYIVVFGFIMATMVFGGSPYNELSWPQAVVLMLFAQIVEHMRFHHIIRRMAKGDRNVTILGGRDEAMIYPCLIQLILLIGAGVFADFSLVHFLILFIGHWALLIMMGLTRDHGPGSVDGVLELR